MDSPRARPRSSWTRATASILALANWPRVDANNVGDAPDWATPEPRGRRLLRARLDLQGLHGRRRAGGRRSRPDTDFDLPPHDRGRRPRDRRGAPARLRHAHGPRDPPEVVQRRHGHDRPAARREALRPLGAPLRLRPADRRRPAGRGAAASCSPREKLLGLLDGQPADRPGPRGHADADGDRLRGDRQRRHPAPAAHGRVGRRRHGGARGPAASSPRRPRRRAARHARGRPRPGRHRRPAPRSRATCWPARPAPRRSPTRSRAATPRPTSSRRSSASRRPSSPSCWSR